MGIPAVNQKQYQILTSVSVLLDFSKIYLHLGLLLTLPHHVCIVRCGVFSVPRFIIMLLIQLAWRPDTSDRPGTWRTWALHQVSFFFWASRSVPQKYISICHYMSLYVYKSMYRELEKSGYLGSKEMSCRWSTWSWSRRSALIRRWSLGDSQKSRISRHWYWNFNGIPHENGYEWDNIWVILWDNMGWWDYTIKLS